jgi:hypothetical protein
VHVIGAISLSLYGRHQWPDKLLRQMGQKITYTVAEIPTRIAMRRATITAILALSLNVCAHTATPVAAATVKMPRMVCDPAQLLDLSKSIGRFVCVTSDLLDNLTVTKPLIEAAARSPDASRTSDPNAITCGLPSNQQRDIQHLYCASNGFWALAKQGQGPAIARTSFPEQVPNDSTASSHGGGGLP